MVMYEIVALRTDIKEKDNFSVREEMDIYNTDLTINSDDVLKQSKGTTVVLPFTIYRIKSYFVALSDTQGNAMHFIEKYMKKLPFPIKDYKVHEICFSKFKDRLENAERNGFITDTVNLLSKFGIENLVNHRGGFVYAENIIDENVTMEDIKHRAKEILFSDTMFPELERIAVPAKLRTAIGHPVHYIVRTDSKETRRTACRDLLTALYLNGRVKNKRYAFLDIDNDSYIPLERLEALYRLSEGGAVIIRYVDADEKEEQFGRCIDELIEGICEVAEKHKRSVLTIFCVGQAINRVKEEYMSGFDNVAFVELCENISFYEEAKVYLKAKARECKLKPDNKLFALLEDNKGYNANELNKLFDGWHSNKIRTVVYPQYSDAKTSKKIVKDAKYKGDAYEKLESLIGLENAKDVMQKALNYFKARKLFEGRGVMYDNPSMHMVFTGNPGTAKTTVARLFARIMRDNNLICKGDIYEVGRADLVGRYVGSTAPLVKTAFKKAKGGVLFIDEAYSLVDDRDGLFGDEAINTIVQEMENNRQDTVVIFAGYPDKMEKFLSKNPGLRSRISFHIPFEDYSAEELCNIAEFIADEKGLVIDDSAKEKLQSVFESARENSDFGNGRFARNVIEKAVLAQANRLMTLDFEKVTDTELKTICAEDIEMPCAAENKIVRLGFSA